MDLPPADHGIVLYWLPLGAGGDRCVQTSGRTYERVAARRDRRPPARLYHAACELRVDGRRFTLEMAPAWSGPPGDHGVVATGPVGLRWLGRSRWFRYEVRCWPEGTIPDLVEAVGGPTHVPTTPQRTTRALALVPAFPTAIWGRDELRTGDMWNSNSLIAWVLAASGHALTALRPPTGGRAPGWDAGLTVAARTATGTTPATDTRS